MRRTVAPDSQARFTGVGSHNDEGRPRLLVSVMGTAVVEQVPVVLL